MMRFSLRTLALLATLLASFTASRAATYTFTLTGFTSGGVVGGTFEGNDFDGDGQLASFTGEISSFSMTFSGDSLVPDFTHTLPDLKGLVYFIGSGILGDQATGPYGEGLFSQGSGPNAAAFAAGVGITPALGGSVWVLSTGVGTTTPSHPLVSEVPEPTIVYLAMVGAISLLLAHRLRDA